MRGPRKKTAKELRINALSVVAPVLSGYVSKSQLKQEKEKAVEQYQRGLMLFAANIEDLKVGDQYVDVTRLIFEVQKGYLNQLKEQKGNIDLMKKADEYLTTKEGEK